MNTSVIDMSRARDLAERETESRSLIQVIERAARDPNIDIDKMERLLAMQERITARQAEAAYAAALARLQPKLPTISERGSIKNNSGAVQSRYALWEDIVGIIGPILASEGFSLSFRIAHPDKQIEVTGVLQHEAGHKVSTSIQLPSDTSGSKNAVQAVASSVSYGKRYTAGALLNLRTGEADRDGQDPEPEMVSEEQIANLQALITEVGADKVKFLKYLKVNSLGEIYARNYTAVVKSLEAKRARP
jgi:hypothetical protein